MSESRSRPSEQKIPEEDSQPEGVTWPSGWSLFVHDDGTIIYAECPICHQKINNRISARKHERLNHKPVILLDDGCCSCWKHC